MALRVKLASKCLTLFAFLAPIHLTPGLAQSKWSTPAQVEGPYYPRTKPKEVDSNLLDFLGARVEIWQNDNNGIYNHHKAPNREKFDRRFQGFGSFITKKDGRYNFITLVPVPDHKRPPHIHVKIFRGQKEILTTQLYIKDHPENNRDGLLSLMLYPGQHKLLIELKDAVIKPGLRGKLGTYDFVLSKNF